MSGSEQTKVKIHTLITDYVNKQSMTSAKHPSIHRLSMTLIRCGVIHKKIKTFICVRFFAFCNMN